MSPTPEARRIRNRTWLGVALITASLVVVGIGVQSFLYQREQADDLSATTERQIDSRIQQRCFELWGQEVIDTIETRNEATTAQERAEEARDNALDDALLILKGALDDPPLVAEDALNKAAQRYYLAVRDLRETRDATQETRQQNPYPELDC